MIRALAYSLIFLMVITVVRAAIGLIGKAFTDAFAGSSGGSGPRPGGGGQSQSLHKDPVCGTFVAASTAVQKYKDGKTHYFCSAACRDQY